MLLVLDMFPNRTNYPDSLFASEQLNYVNDFVYTVLMVSLQFLHLYIYISTSTQTTILEKDFNLVNNKTRQRMIVINCNGLAS